MAKVSRKPSEPNTETDQPTSSSKQGRMKKVPGQPKSENGGKALKKATKFKKNLQRTLSKNVSEKPTNSIRKSKKTRQSTRFSHYHRLNETLHQNDPEQNQEEVQKPISGSKDLGSQVTSE
ncbi:spermatid nuclear transition protein 4-like [Oryx dammah]|uniref:spermatid nuclear transition protein 4-like n=1 Tax=Oryx dammah TaxID=59534 RepID=UPI001A9BD70B|nr:spermatid nuclear transition protein 4-like [Oryx dammah]